MYYLCNSEVRMEKRVTNKLGYVEGKKGLVCFWNMQGVFGRGLRQRLIQRRIKKMKYELEQGDQGATVGLKMNSIGLNLKTEFKK